MLLGNENNGLFHNANSGCSVVRSMQRVLLFASFAALSGCASLGTSALEKRFERERASLTRFDGTTSEESCGGTGLSVYLNGQELRLVGWCVETSRQLIYRDYYFDGSTPSLVTETTYALLDANAERLEKPRLLSTKRYRLDTPQAGTEQKEFLEHAKFLIDDYNKNRKSFSRVAN